MDGTAIIGATSTLSERSKTDLPGGVAGAFYEYNKPEDVLGRVKSLDKHSKSFWSGAVDPDKIVSGDKTTYAKPSDITSYVESLAPENTYYWGLRENEPGVDYTKLKKAEGGIARLG